MAVRCRIQYVGRIVKWQARVWLHRYVWSSGQVKMLKRVFLNEVRKKSLVL